MIKEVSQYVYFMYRDGGLRVFMRGKGEEKRRKMEKVFVGSDTAAS